MATKGLSRLSRALHTSRVILKDLPEPTPASLGFSTQKRERVLPTLEVPKSSRRAIGVEKASGAAGGKGDKGDKGDKRDKTATRPKGDKTFSKKQQSPRSSAQRGTSVDAIPAEFFEGAELAEQPSTSNARSSNKGDRTQNRRDRKPRDGKKGGSSGPRQQNAGGKSNTTTPAPPQVHLRTAPRPLAARALPQAREAKVTVKRDGSARSLFGNTSLLFPAVRGAREPTSSVWAQGMEASEARKSDLLRVAGSYQTFLPAVPSGKGQVAAKGLALHAVGLNPSIGLRKRTKFADSLKPFLG